MENLLFRAKKTINDVNRSSKQAVGLVAKDAQESLQTKVLCMGELQSTLDKIYCVGKFEFRLDEIRSLPRSTNRVSRS